MDTHLLNDVTGFGYVKKSQTMNVWHKASFWKRTTKPIPSPEGSNDSSADRKRSWSSGVHMTFRRGVLSNRMSVLGRVEYGVGAFWGFVGEFVVDEGAEK